MTGPAGEVPGWITDAYPSASGWRAVGERRWQALMPALGCEPLDLLVLVNEAGTGGVYHASILADWPDHAVAEVWRKMQTHLDRAALPPCVAPDCEQKAPVVFVVVALGFLAGRLHQPGDRVALCTQHAADVYTDAGGAQAPSAGWLAIDAEPLDDETLDVVTAYTTIRERARTVQAVRTIGGLP